jgi:cathepsin L
MKYFNKSYNHNEFIYRFEIFKKNLDFIDKHNSNKNKTFTVGMNQFGDLTIEEFKYLYLGVNIPKFLNNSSLSNLKKFQHIKGLQLPENFSWYWYNNVVGPPKNQGQCGACWAFSTTGSVEGCYGIKTGTYVSLSEQNLIDCSTAYPNEGCNGGNPMVAMQYIIDNGGIDTEASYPYTAQDGTCNFNPSTVGATLTGYYSIPSGNEEALQQAVYKGPTSVLISGATDSSFQFYSGGIYNNPSCNSQPIDHAMVAIGWGVENGTPYWVLQNSWGSSWGNPKFPGLIAMMRNDNNQCFIASYATLPEC